MGRSCQIAWMLAAVGEQMRCPPHRQPPAAKPEDMKQTRLLIEAVCAFCGVTPLPVLAESGILLPQPARANRKSSGGPGTDLGECQLLQDEHETRVAVPGRFSAAGPNRRRP